MNTKDKALAKATELGVSVNAEYSRFAIELTAPKGQIFASSSTDKFVAEYDPEKGDVRRMAWRKVIQALNTLSEKGGKA